MISDPKEPPDFARATQRHSDDEVWQEIEAHFHSLRDVVTNTRMETREQAIGEDGAEDKHVETRQQAIGEDRAKIAKRKPKADWQDTAPKWGGNNVRAWLLTPYIEAVDQEYLGELYDGAAQLIATIEAAIGKRELTPQFVRDWGVFCWAAGGIELIHLSDPDDVSHLRRGQANTENRDTEHERWYANYIQRQLRSGRSRKNSDKAFQQLVLHLLWTPAKKLNTQEQAFIETVGADWIQEFLANYEDENDERLRSKFSGKHMYGKKLKSVLAQPTDDLPDLTLPIPKF